MKQWRKNVIILFDFNLLHRGYGRMLMMLAIAEKK